MSDDKMMMELKKSDPALYNELKQEFVKDMEILDHTPRLPQVKISHGNKLFVFPNDTTVSVLEGVVLAVGNFKELYDNNNEEKKAPICSSINSPMGSQYGLCKECKYWEWGSGKNGKGRACSGSRRVIISVKGHPTPFELKVSTTAANDFDKAMSNATTTHQKNVFLLNFTASLTVEGEGQRAYSKLHPKFELPEALDMEAVRGRLKLRKEYSEYYENVYGGMTVNAEESHPDDIIQEDGSTVITEGTTAAKPTKSKGKGKKKEEEIVLEGEEIDVVPF